MAQQSPIQPKATPVDQSVADFVKSRNFYGGAEGELGEALAALVRECGGDPERSEGCVPEVLDRFKTALESYTGTKLD